MLFHKPSHALMRDQFRTKHSSCGLVLANSIGHSRGAVPTNLHVCVHPCLLAQLPTRTVNEIVPTLCLQSSSIRRISDGLARPQFTHSVFRCNATFASIRGKCCGHLLRGLTWRNICTENQPIPGGERLCVLVFVSFKTEASWQCVQANQVTGQVLDLLTEASPNKDDGEITVSISPMFVSEQRLC